MKAISLFDETQGSWLGHFPELKRRSDYSIQCWKKLDFASQVLWPRLEFSMSNNTSTIAEKSCIYVTGSMARNEATEGSDLDLFVVHEFANDDAEKHAGSLSYIEESRLVAALDEVRAGAGFRPFSRGGEFVKAHSFQDIKSQIGDRVDDFSNTFTARLLLLMNSRPLLNVAAFNGGREEVLSAYWDRTDPDSKFLPLMLTNDIRRWWGVLCLNFERYNRRVKDRDFESTPDRRVQNLKLKYSKLLSVYSVLLDLIDVSDQTGLTRNEAREVFDALPLDRLVRVARRNLDNQLIQGLVEEILHSYDKYLAAVALPKDELISHLEISDNWEAMKQDAYQFHDRFFALYSEIGGRGSPLFDYCVV